LPRITRELEQPDLTESSARLQSDARCRALSCPLLGQLVAARDASAVDCPPVLPILCSIPCWLVLAPPPRGWRRACAPSPPRSHTAGGARRSPAAHRLGDCPGQQADDAEQRADQLVWQVGQCLVVAPGDDQAMPGEERPVVEEDEGLLVRVDDMGWHLSGQEVTESALRRTRLVNELHGGYLLGALRRILPMSSPQNNHIVWANDHLPLLSLTLDGTGELDPGAR